MRKANNEKFILFENCFMELENPYTLTPDELYLYAYMYKYQNFENELMINIDTLHLGINYYKRKSNTTKTVSMITDCVMSLNDKKVIEINNLENKTNRQSVLLIRLPFAISRLTNKKTDDKVNGFVPIDYSILKQCDDPYELYIYSMVKKFQNAEHLIFSFGQWSKHLGLKRSTAQDRVNKFINEKGLIYKESGAWVQIDNLNKVFKQDVNKYKIVESQNDAPKINLSDSESSTVTKKVINDSVATPSIIRDSSDNYIESRKHNWYSTKEEKIYPIIDDYYIYLTTQDDKLKLHADKRMAALSKSDYGKSQVEKLMSEAKEILKLETKKLKQVEKMKYNYVKLFNGETIRIDKNNVHSINFDQVDKFSYSVSGNDISEGDFLMAVRMGIKDRTQVDDNKFYSVVKEFKQLICDTDRLVTSDQVVEIRRRHNPDEKVIVEDEVYNHR